MRFASSISLLIASLSLPALGQYSGLNVTPITGTWSSGSQNVVPGQGFANPANLTFNYPATAGIGVSFSADGFYEWARYRFNGNGSQPTCITGVLNWVHGQYSFLSNGSILMTPLGDGYQQIQDACAAQSNFVENYNDTELMLTWNIVQDPTTGFKLYLWQFDGTQLSPMGLVSTTPSMLPTQLLRNVTPVFNSQNGFVTTGGKVATGNVLISGANRAMRRWGEVLGGVTGVSLVLGAGALAMSVW